MNNQEFINELEALKAEFFEHNEKLKVDDVAFYQVQSILDKYNYNLDVYEAFEDDDTINFEDYDFCMYEAGVNNPFDDEILEKIEEIEELRDEATGYYITINLYGVINVATKCDLNLVIDDVIEDVKNKVA